MSQIITKDQRNHPIRKASTTTMKLMIEITESLSVDQTTARTTKTLIETDAVHSHLTIHSNTIHPHSPQTLLRRRAAHHHQHLLVLSPPPNHHLDHQPYPKRIKKYDNEPLLLILLNPLEYPENHPHLHTRDLPLKIKIKLPKIITNK
jgi:hypothetical protein